MTGAPLPLLIACGPAKTGPRAGTGYVAVLIMIMLTASIATLGLVVDIGLAIAADTRAQTAADEAARAGADQIDLDFLRTTSIVRLDPAAARTAAAAWLAATGHTGTVTATVAEVTVTVETTHPSQILTAFGVGSIPATATAAAAPHQGDDLAAPPIEGSPP